MNTYFASSPKVHSFIFAYKYLAVHHVDVVYCGLGRLLISSYRIPRIEMGNSGLKGLLFSLS